jgi:hypothetical protein
MTPDGQQAAQVPGDALQRLDRLERTAEVTRRHAPADIDGAGSELGRLRESPPRARP